MNTISQYRTDNRELSEALDARDDELRDALATIEDQQATIQQLEASLERYRVAVANCIHSADRLAQVMADAHCIGLAAFVNAHLEGLGENVETEHPTKEA